MAARVDDDVIQAIKRVRDDKDSADWTLAGFEGKGSHAEVDGFWVGFSCIECKGHFNLATTYLLSLSLSYVNCMRHVMTLIFLDGIKLLGVGDGGVEALKKCLITGDVCYGLLRTRSD